MSRRYRLLELLGQGGMGRVYAALDRLTGRQVALKQVALPGPAIRVTPTGPLAHPLADTVATLRSPKSLRRAGSQPTRLGGQELRLRLAHEFRTLASMRHPHIVSVLDYGFDEEGRPFYTMELLRGAAPLLQRAGEWQLDTQVELVAQLLRALCYLHRRGVLHRDLKPANLLVLALPQGPTLKVLDFGLALAREHAGLALGEISGTLGYLAPEVLLGEPPSESADLFAAGAVAYQLLTGRPAFAAGDDDALLEAMFSGRVELAPLRPLGRIGEVIARLLAHSPEARFASAGEALAALAEASGRPLLDEDSALRDSFLHTARFVGRERESDLLRGALAEAARGHGATWLIGGASGIGKSRLLDELRTLALVQGVLTARGQSVTSASRPYRVFHDALRLLSLHVELTDPEADALRMQLLDLDALPERSAAELPVLDAQGAQQRLLRAVESMVGRLRRPLLLLLEDLQWADPESLALLAHLTRTTAHQPVLLVGTYRDDESPRLPTALPGAHVLKLTRLSQPSVAALSESILGPRGRRPDLLTLLERETEGNAFFLVEVLRALAEQVGGLSAVGSGQLPEQVCAGGITAVLERRLGGVPPWARLGLRRCAVRGRRLDLRALPRWVAEPSRFLQACADAGVLEVAFDDWQFSHDKLRERILESLAPQEARVLHYDVAEALEWAYPDASQHSAAIAEHYQLAAAAVRAAPHRVRAAALALHQGALEAAVHHSRAGLAAPPGALSAMEQARAQQLLVQALFELRRIDECIEAAESLAGRAGGALSRCRQLGRAVPVGMWLARRVLRRQAPTHERELAREQLLTGLLSAEAHVLRGNAQGVALVALRNLKLAEQADDAALRAMSSVGVGFVAEAGGLHWLSDRLLRRSARYLQGIRDPRAELEYLRIRGLVLIGRGELAEGEAQLVEALRCADELDSDELRLFVRSLLTISAALHGDCGRTRERARALTQAAGPSQHPQYLSAGRLYQALAALRAGDLAEAEADLDAAAAQQRLCRLPALDFCLATRRALLALRRADRPAAVHFAEQALAKLPQLPVYTPAHVHYFGSLVEVCLGLAEAAEPRSERTRFLAAAELTLGSLRTLIRRHPVAQGPCWLYEGQLAEQLGQPERARLLLLRARARAELQGLPLDLALARRALGKLERDALDPEAARHAREHLSAAAALFGQLGARAEQAETLRLLAPPTRPAGASRTRGRAVRHQAPGIW